jgi:hypothetical protein
MTQSRYWSENPRPDDLGVVVHGPAVVARAPGIAVAVRCVFARPDGLALDLMLRAHGVQADAAARQSGPVELTGRPEAAGSEPVLTITADETTALVQGPQSGSAGDDHFSLDLQAWVDILPTDGRLTVTAGWPEAGLATGSAILTLAPLTDLDARVLRLP